jgi:hypothetical protein
VGDAEPADPTGFPLALEPRQVLAPGNEVVDLLDLDPAEPGELRRELRLRLVGRRGPDLGRDDRLVATLCERVPERPFGELSNSR